MIAVAVTPPSLTPANASGLAREIESVLDDAGWDRVNLRFPEADRELTTQLIDKIPSRLWPRLTLHDHHDVAAERGLGVQLNGRHPVLEVPRERVATVSASCHSVDEVIKAADLGLDYVTLSPVFDSISKAGYSARSFDMSALLNLPIKVLALGGVTPERLTTVSQAGFDGYAVLGALPWGEPLDNFIRIAKKFISCSNL